MDRILQTLNSVLPFRVSPHSIYFGFAAYVLYKFVKADADLRLRIAMFLYPQYRLCSVFRDKVVWITGASSGLGKGLALELANYPCKIVLSARRESELQDVKKMCLEINPARSDDSVMVLQLDCLKFDELPSSVAKVKNAYGRIDYLVNNAGRSQRSLVEDTPIDVDRAIMELNFFGLVALTKAVIPLMKEQRSGNIVGVSSIAGKMGSPVSSAYSASKHAVNGFYDTLRMELYSYGINVQTVCPGPVRSNISLHSFTETLGQSYSENNKNAGRKQETHRFAELMAVSMAANIPETWICIQPYLLYVYLAQYFPTIIRSFIFSKAAQSRITKFKNKECLY